MGVVRSAYDPLLDRRVALKLLRPGGTTRHGAIMGTPGYMSPEQLRGESSDACSDQSNHREVTLIPRDPAVAGIAV